MFPLPILTYHSTSRPPQMLNPARSPQDSPHVDDGFGRVVWEMVEPLLSTPGVQRAGMLLLMGATEQRTRIRSMRTECDLSVRPIHVLWCPQCSVWPTHVLNSTLEPCLFCRLTCALGRSVSSAALPITAKTSSPFTSRPQAALLKYLGSPVTTSDSCKFDGFARQC